MIHTIYYRTYMYMFFILLYLYIYRYIDIYIYIHISMFFVYSCFVGRCLGEVCGDLCRYYRRSEICGDLLRDLWRSVESLPQKAFAKALGSSWGALVLHSTRALHDEPKAFAKAFWEGSARTCLLFLKIFVRHQPNHVFIHSFVFFSSSL